ncbi:N-acetyl-gamma-glutamyl-phosphate reductase [Motilibacter aurantiacus]|uniref:N-acetyl-gamma-glutamyl-phosphate reductase n=1 Tax=Motilibacter aurantiacus TaxID=2714955 RepID=UPI00140875A3|nr:N-acetyl-gamma-glutamyl-phosphate reductase [Motilibacter aurantiacus]NHC45956.1 N-acetyl-gamma-glutamyl-phosphate reductase [Motilibacter aurantiacus]
MGLTVAVTGASGYAGGELLRLLAGHPELDVTTVTAASSAGTPLAAAHPHLAGARGLGDLVLRPTDPAELAGHDVVFLAMPHGQSAAVARELEGSGALVVDLGADHRLTDPGTWESYYGGAHAGTWPYGLPELPGQRQLLRGARRIAAPGCYPTSVALGLAPVLAAGLVAAQDVVVVAASGTSGAGRSAKVALLGSEVMGAVSAYKAGGAHQHTPEMEQTLTTAAGSPVTLSFTPLLAPMPRGILATCTAALRPEVTTAQLREALQAAYADEPFVTLLPEGVWPTTAATAGSNSAHVQAAADTHAGRAVVTVAIDNLGKGAAGQALQCANIALGLPEECGLSVVGAAP